MSLFSKRERFLKSSLFRRLFLVITAALLVTALILTGVMVVLVRGERQSALENELRLQARDFAQMMRQSDSIIIWRDASLISGNIRDKLNELRNEYAADVWLLRQNGMLMSFGENTASVSTLSDQEAVAQIYRVLEGSEITVRGLFSELGDTVVTIGVPWTDWSGQVQGAVLLHVSVNRLSADYSDILRYSGIGALVAMVFGVALSYAIARRQSGPVKEIQQVVADFAAGNLASRAQIHGHDDMAVWVAERIVALRHRHCHIFVTDRCNDHHSADHNKGSQAFPERSDLILKWCAGDGLFRRCLFIPLHDIPDDPPSHDRKKAQDRKPLHTRQEKDRA